MSNKRLILNWLQRRNRQSGPTWKIKSWSWADWSFWSTEIDRNVHVASEDNWLDSLEIVPSSFNLMIVFKLWSSVNSCWFEFRHRLAKFDIWGQHFHQVLIIKLLLILYSNSISSLNRLRQNVFRIVKFLFTFFYFHLQQNIHFIIVVFISNNWLRF